MQLLPYNVLLKRGWSVYLNWENLNTWIRENNVAVTDWDYYTSGVVSSKYASIGFRYEEDATMFKLRFGL